MLLAFDLLSLIEIKAAHTCSKPRTDGFGGHACIVTKEAIRWSSLHDFLNAESAAHEKSERYFMCDLIEINGEYEYASHFLMKCAKDDDPDQRLDNIFINYRGKSDKESDDFVWYESGTAAKNPSMTEITPYEFNLMQSHLSVL